MVSKIKEKRIQPIFLTDIGGINIDEMITIHERLSKIETQNQAQSEILADIKKMLHGNGRIGLCNEVSLNRKCIDDLFKWRTRHEKNIKWWTVLLIGTCLTIIGTMQYYI